MHTKSISQLCLWLYKLLYDNPNQTHEYIPFLHNGNVVLGLTRNTRYPVAVMIVVISYLTYFSSNWSSSLIPNYTDPSMSLALSAPTPYLPLHPSSSPHTSLLSSCLSPSHASFSIHSCPPDQQTKRPYSPSSSSSGSKKKGHNNLKDKDRDKDKEKDKDEIPTDESGNTPCFLFMDSSSYHAAKRITDHLRK